MARIPGTRGRDQLYGTPQDDQFYGYEDNDTFWGSRGNDFYDGGTGFDYVSYEFAPKGIVVELWRGQGQDGEGSIDTYSGIEGIVGSAFRDQLYGDDNSNALYGGGDDDILVGFGERDWLYGNDGNDRLYGDEGDDRLYGGDDQDILTGGSGADIIDGGEGIDTVSYAGSSKAVYVYLDSAAGYGRGYEEDESAGYTTFADLIYNVENITGSRHNDTLLGDASSNVLKGLDGDDTFEVSGGGDVLNGGDGLDRASYGSAAAGVRVDLLAPGTNTGDAAGDTFISIEEIWGSRYNDTLLGDDNDNSIFGADGADILDGRGGNDTLWGASWSHVDTFVFFHDGHSNEHDTVMDFQLGVDRIDLSDTAVQGFNDLFSPGDRYMEQVGNDVLIHTSVSASTDILLSNVQMSSLTSADFLF
jgi:Ca2+-binding RTX toxin-like protein